MNKTELVRSYANKMGCTIKDAENSFEAFIDVITESLKKGEKIQVVGFGTFEVKHKPAREAKNPATGEKVHVAASDTPVLKFSKAYKAQF